MKPSFRPEFFWLALILVGAAALRLFDTGSYELWWDEVVSLRYSETLRSTYSNSVHPPLYYVLLVGWRELFGSTEIALRSLSAVFGVLNVGLVYWLGRKWLGSGTLALAAAALFAVFPFAVAYGREARMYSLWTTFVLLAVIAAQGVIANPRSWRPKLLYLAALAGGVLTHHYMIFFAFGCAFCMLITASNSPQNMQTFGRKLRLTLAIHLPIFALGCATLALLALRKDAPIEYLLRQISQFSGPFSAIGIVTKLGNTINLLPNDYVQTLPSLLAGAIALGIVLQLAIRGGRDGNSGLVQLAIMAAIPYILIAALPIRHDWTRYYYPATPFICLSMTCFFAQFVTGPYRLSQWRLHSLNVRGLTIVSICALVFLASIYPSRLQAGMFPYRIPWRAVVQTIAEFDQKHPRVKLLLPRTYGPDFAYYNTLKHVKPREYHDRKSATVAKRQITKPLRVWQRRNKVEHVFVLRHDASTPILSDKHMVNLLTREFGPVQTYYYHGVVLYQSTRQLTISKTP